MRLVPTGHWSFVLAIGLVTAICVLFAETYTLCTEGLSEMTGRDILLSMLSAGFLVLFVGLLIADRYFEKGRSQDE